jgi:hypothetical protein
VKEYCKIELVLKEKLEDNDDDSLFANYILTRKYLFKNIYPKIGEILPDFTYHDGSHVVNVLDNIFQLLDDLIYKISCETLYFLCLSTLFHDVGLIYGRNEHQKKIGDIYNSARGRDSIQNFGNEKIIVAKAVEAHSGKAIDNTYDTLRYLDKLSGYSEMINIQEIAAILKFADELAEGGQRTSDYFIENNMYNKNAKIFHRYSQAYQSVISVKNNRLAITYNIIVYFSNSNELLIDQDIGLELFLNFIYERLLKIDDERKYCRYYCSWLEPMKEISVVFNFWYKDERIGSGLSPIVFSDKIVPGETKRIFEKSFPDYIYSNINDILIKQISNLSSEALL